MRGGGLLQKVQLVLAMTHYSSAAAFPSPSLSSLLSSATPHPPTFTTTTTIMPDNDDNTAISHQKRALRSKLRRDLKALSPTQRNQEDITIQSIVLESPWFKSSTRLCAYISCESLREVDTSRILSEVLSDSATDPYYPLPIQDDITQIKKKLYVPRVEDNNSHMRMLNISSIQDLVANSMNILEPAPLDDDGNQREDVMLASHPVDMFLLPGVAFDKSGWRLGRGGGYYDVFLKKYQELAAERKWKQPLRVALAYSVQIMDEEVIPVTHNDIPVDALVSPSGVIPISPAALERM